MLIHRYVRFGLLTVFLISMFHPVAGYCQYLYKDSSKSVHKRVQDLLHRMTLDEKIGQVRCEIREIPPGDTALERGLGSLAVPLRPLGPADAAVRANQIQKSAIEKSRLGIPVLIHDEGLHGLIGKGATSFPQAIGLASTWDTTLVHRVASVIARQSKDRGIRQLLSPVLNIARDVRWGRVEETYGEDPVLTSAMGVAFCRGLEEQNVASTVKHFAANLGDGGRDSYPVHFSERIMREIYFPAFRACIQNGRASSVMAAYNSLDGIPCSSNRWLLTDVLRKEWGFSGFVVSDYGSVGGILDLHHAARTKIEAARQALSAGMDIELPGPYIFGDSLKTAIVRGDIKVSALDSAVARVLAAKFRLGLFEHPYVDPGNAERTNDTPSDRALALEAAHKSAVLLKNENNTLPLSRELRNIAVIGPRADSKILGGYSGSGMKVVSVLEGIRNFMGSSAAVQYAKGCEISQSILPPIPGEYLVPSDAAPGEHGLRAEYFNNMILSGPPSLVRTDKELNFDWGSGSPDSAIHNDHFSARWTGKLIPPKGGICMLGITSDDGVRLYLDGKLMVDSWIDRAPATDFVTVKLDSGKAYDLRVEYYENGGGAVAMLGWDVGIRTDTLHDEAVSVASKAGTAIVVVGINEGEGADRSILDLPGEQEKLIADVAATGVPTVVILMAGSAVTMNSWMDKVAAILDIWYGGEECGNSVADILFGKVNPGGKLPITFPRSVGQVPLYYNYKPSGRGYDYIDGSGNPLFPFGYGLSYTTFAYSNLRISPEVIPPAQAKKGKQDLRYRDSVTVSFQVQNTGSREGDEVVQCYLHSTVDGMTRPFRELRKFRRITLGAGQSAEIRFVLRGDDLGILGPDLKVSVLPGLYEVLVGSSSEDIRLKGSFSCGNPVVKRGVPH